MALKHIDQDGIYPGGKRGLPGRAAMAIVNENSAEAEERLSALESGNGGVADAIEGLQRGLTSEAQIRAELDAALDARIDSEQMARQAADEALAALTGRIPGKNALINGNFDFAQRGVAGSRTSAEYIEFYSVDRWVCGFVGISGNWGVGGTPLGEIGGSRRFLGYNIVSVANNNSAAYVGQKIENCDTFAGKTVTLSLWARSNVPGKKIGARILQLMGTGGSPSANTSTECRTVAILTTSFKRYSFTVTLPSMAGKTRGTSGNDSLFVVLDYCADSAFYSGQLVAQTGLIEIAQAQLEEGDVATRFELRPLALEVVLCQRYYEKSYQLDVTPGSANSAGHCGEFLGVQRTGGNFWMQRFAVTKRATPSIQVFASANGALNQVSQDNGSTVAVTSVAQVGQTGFQIGYSNPSGRYGGAFHFVAESEL